MTDLLVLHWGQVSQEVIITGVSPGSGNIEALKSNSMVKSQTASGVVSGISGSGGLKVSGRGGKTSLKGRGKI